MQDNQQKWMSFWSVIKRPSLTSLVDRFQTFQTDAKQKKATESYASSTSNMENLRVAWMNTQNHWIAKTCDRAIKLTQVADWIRDYYRDQIDFTDSFWTDDKVVDEYLTANPNSEPYLKAYVTNDADTTCDPTELYKTMGRWKDDAEEEKKSWWWLWTWTKNVAKNFLSAFEQWGDAVANFIQGTIGEWEWDQTPWALENYAKMNFGKDFYSLTDEEKAEAREAVSTKEWMATYEPTPQRVVSKWAEAGLDFFFTTNAPWLKLAFSTANEIKWLDRIVKWIGTLVEFWGSIIDLLPPLRQFKNSLQTDDEKKQWDEFVGSLWLMKLLQKRGGRLNKDTAKETVIKELDPEITIKEFQNRVLNLPWDIKDWIWNIRDWKATPEKLQETAGKIANTKTVAETESATRWLQDIDFKWVKTYKDLEDVLTKKWSEIEALEDAEYAKDTTKYKPEETRGMKTYTKDGYSSSVLLKPVEDWIALLKDFYEWSPEKLAQLDLIEQKFQNEWLTKAEINSISRAIAQEYDTYKARWQQKTSIAAKNVEEIRRAVKNFAREWNDRLVELDKLWSDNMNTKAMIKDVQNEIVKAKNKLASKNIFQKGMWKLGELIDFFGWKALLSKILPKLAWDDTINAITRQKQLKKMLNKFKRLNKRLDWAKTETEVNEIIDEFKAEVVEWPIEWEVLSTDYLEDMSE